jgi:hypothetical protein
MRRADLDTGTLEGLEENLFEKRVSLSDIFCILYTRLLVDKRAIIDPRSGEDAVVNVREA